MSGPTGHQRPANSPGKHGGAGSDGENNPGWTIFGYLLGGMAVYGGLGWLIGRWVGNQPVCLAVGMIIGLALAITLVIFRYGRA